MKSEQLEKWVKVELAKAEKVIHASGYQESEATLNPYKTLDSFHGEHIAYLKIAALLQKEGIDPEIVSIKITWPWPTVILLVASCLVFLF